MDTKYLKHLISNLINEFTLILNNLANVYENAVGTGLVLEYYDGLVVQFDFVYNKLSFVVMDEEEGLSNNLEIYTNIDWGNNYELDHICKLIRQYYEKYHQTYGGDFLLKMPNLKNF